MQQSACCLFVAFGSLRLRGSGSSLQPAAASLWTPDPLLPVPLREDRGAPCVVCWCGQGGPRTSTPSSYVFGCVRL